MYDFEYLMLIIGICALAVLYLVESISLFIREIKREKISNIAILVCFIGLSISCVELPRVAMAFNKGTETWITYVEIFLSVVWYICTFRIQD